MHFTYILQSETTGRYYIGITGDVAERLRRHNAGATKATRPYRPWKAVVIEKYLTSTDARKRELQLKRMKGGEGFKELLR